MKMHIENLNITYSCPHLPMAGIMAGELLTKAEKLSHPEPKIIPAIGEKWPGIEAIYAGIALSQNEDSLIHLVLWDESKREGMTYDKAVDWAANVNTSMSSHIPTRHQSINLFENVCNHLDTEYWHWTLTKTNDGKAAFHQRFYDGGQSHYDLSAELRVRAVSEIPL